MVENSFPARSIGLIHTPFAEAVGTPIQPVFAQGAIGQVIIDEQYAAALDDIEGFDRIWLIYWLNRASAFQPRVIPYRDTKEHGLFATRSPCRPNPIGMSTVRLLGREGCALQVADVDVLDGTPLLDLKPYVPQFDAFPGSKAGWFEQTDVDRQVSDERFYRGTNFKR